MERTVGNQEIKEDKEEREKGEGKRTGTLKERFVIILFGPLLKKEWRRRTGADE